MAFDSSIPYRDTLLAHHAYASHLPQGLSQLVSEFRDSGPWKITHRGGGKKEKPENLSPAELALYNAADCRLTIGVWHDIQRDPAFRREFAVFEHDLCLAELCAELMTIGMPLDPARKRTLTRKMREERDTYLRLMRGILGKAGPKFSPSKLENVRYAVFTLLRVKSIKSTSTGLPYTGKELIENLRGDETRAGRFAEALSKWREVGKIKRTYLDALDPITWEDASQVSRVHFSWGPRESRRGSATIGGGHTVSGRLASRIQSAPKYNPRNTPDRVREIYRAPPGRRLVYFDVKQGEPRVAAYLSGDPNMIRVCESGDVHAGNAKIMFPTIAAKGWLDDPEAKKDPARGKPCRDLAKNMGLAINYFAEAERVYSFLLANRFDPQGRPLYEPLSILSVNAIISKIRFEFRRYVDFVAHPETGTLAQVKRTGHMRDPILGRLRVLGWSPSITDVANYPIQSCLAAVMNLRTLALQGYSTFRSWVAEHPEIAARVSLPSNTSRWPRLPRSARIILQHHDSCTYEVNSADARNCLDAISEIWQGQIVLPGGKMILPLDLKEGERWSDF